jgi:hypothetical protein
MRVRKVHFAEAGEGRHMAKLELSQYPLGRRFESFWAHKFTHEQA